ncbi:MAG: site-2 protease family protein [Balneolales bacterium]|nr:site-2 protease family protein [Balneolales bacterium]
MMRFKNRNISFDRLRLTLDPLLPLVLIVMAWALSHRYYPEVMYLENSWQYWMLGGITAVLITLSIIVHELGHSYTAKKLHIPIERIHLFLFGGMAELQHRPHYARQEFWIAVAGPLASFALAFLSWVIYAQILTPSHLPYNLFRFIALINLLIGVFNLLPIFPLDGGRILRSVLWGIQGNFIEASRLTRKAGSSMVGLLLIGAMVDYFFLEKGYAMIGGVLGLYLLYTYHSGRYELTYAPNPRDLIHFVEEKEGTEEMIRRMIGTRDKVMERCIFPVSDQNGVLQVIDGKKVQLETFCVDPGTIRSAISGDYIDIEQKETWEKSLTYNAEWIPVYCGQNLIGMTDARELRFWMHQSKQLRDFLKEKKHFGYLDTQETAWPNA